MKFALIIIGILLLIIKTEYIKENLLFNPFTLKPALACDTQLVSGANPAQALESLLTFTSCDFTNSPRLMSL